jgi:hypothetical protein
MTNTNSQGSTQGDNLAVDHLKKLKEIYDNLGGGTVTFDYLIHENTFQVILREIPSESRFEFHCPIDMTYKELNKQIMITFQSIIQGSRNKGLAM